MVQVLVPPTITRRRRRKIIRSPHRSLRYLCYGSILLMCLALCAVWQMGIAQQQQHQQQPNNGGDPSSDTQHLTNAHHFHHHGMTAVKRHFRINEKFRHIPPIRIPKQPKNQSKYHPKNPPPPTPLTETGANANCDPTTTTTVSNNQLQLSEPLSPHQDDGTITVYCRTIQYRAPLESFSVFYNHASSSVPPPPPPNESKNRNKQPRVIIGVLSSAGGSGPKRRNTIRNTWASIEGRVGNTKEEALDSLVVFLVAGPWDQISTEYDQYRDLVWIREEEVYQGETSVLTYKTTGFLRIVQDSMDRLGLLVQQQHHHQDGSSADHHDYYDYVFKTDDDCYVSIPKLRSALSRLASSAAASSTITNTNTSSSSYGLDYWGFARPHRSKALRDPSNTWSISYQTYPEPYFPRYCQGAGYALSRRLVGCIAGEGGLGGGGQEEKEGAVANARYMPFEDVAIGLLVERCHAEPTTTLDPSDDVTDIFRMYRGGGHHGERDNVNYGGGKGGVKLLPDADMTGVILQHRVVDEVDMRRFHESELEIRRVGNWGWEGGDGRKKQVV